MARPHFTTPFNWNVLSLCIILSSTAREVKL